MSTTPPTRTQLPRPVFLDNQDQNVVNHPLHCSICCDVSFNPVITPCQHIFCRDCIENGLRSSLTCPNDRRALNQNSLQNIGGLHEYIYSHSLVQCPRCESWKGQFQQYKVHVATCSTSSYVQSLERKVEESTQRLAEERSQHEEEKEQLKNTVSALESRISLMGPVFDVNYRYDEENMVDLARIICRYLYDKPAQIDSNRIYNCIKKCYDRAHDDEYKQLSLKFLLLTSYRSNWFTNNQDIWLSQWCRNIETY